MDPTVGPKITLYNRTLAMGSIVELLTVAELAAMLKMSKSKIYDLMNERTRAGDVREHPLPVLRIGGSVRFIRSDIESWLEKLTRK